jgi:amino acid transporter
MSVLMGVFANYGYVLGKAGPFGLWTWLIVGVGQLLVALVFAEMAGRIPLTGALYNWNSKLSHPGIGWFVGWLIVFAYAVGGVGIIVPMMFRLQNFLVNNQI